ncbi:MAG: hypothetical protein BWY57_01570 [Betaproteobacteria bacterium ADurb.Bin341]|nr:MAG: hypothetical protein BWY57_01570 [Betaproteobacteria bacterium ADurb.Bin341]
MRRLAPALNAGNHPLMPGARQHAVQTPATALDHPDAVKLRQLHQIAHADILARAIDQDFPDRLRILA